MANHQHSMETEIQQTSSRHRQSPCDSLRDFSFNRKTGHTDHDSITRKYSDIYADLNAMEHPDLIELLLEELDENSLCKIQIAKLKNRVQVLEGENSQARDTIQRKREAIDLMCDAESRNLHLIQKLETRISKRNEFGRDTHYEKKYQQLSIYMNEYIRNINQAQQEFKLAYSHLKQENAKAHEQAERANYELDQLLKKCQILSQRVKRYEVELSELSQVNNKLSADMNFVAEENEMLRKEIEVFQENIRITDRLEGIIEKERNQLSSQLDFMRDKDHESRDIIEKLEQSSYECGKTSKEREKQVEALQAKTKTLQKENEALKKINKDLQEDIKNVINEREQLDSDLIQEKLEKEAIRKQLLSMTEKINQMQSVYRKQIEQTDRIKGELFKFWEDKERKETTRKEKVLAEIKPNNSDNSQTISISEKQFKLNLCHKRSSCENNGSILYDLDKENQDSGELQH